jgi:PAS domain-containing protein
LLRAGRQFSAVLERLRMEVMITDVTGRLRHTNPEAVDRGALDWWDSDGGLLEGRSTSIARVLANGETAHETCEVCGADGEPRSLLCTASPLRESDGRLAGVVVIVRDVTERDRLELDLEQRIKRLSAGVQAGRAD